MLKQNLDFSFKSLPYLCMYTLKLKLTKAGIYTLLTSYKTVPQHIGIFSVLLNWFNYGSQSRNRCSQEYIFVCPFLASVWTKIYMAIVGHDGDTFSFADKIRNRALRLGFLWHDINTQAMICQTSEENWCQFIRHGTRNTELCFIFAGQLSLTTTSFVWGRCDTSFLKYFCVPINVCFRRCDCVAMAV